MNIVMLTNTYLPHTGGVARSVAWFAEELRRCNHQVLIVSLNYEGAPQEEPGVIRLPALQNFNGSDFSVRLPVPGLLTSALDEFQPDVVHSHHPFMLGDTALRVASGRDLPIVFTHHTMYEHYTHYVPGDSVAMQRFVIRLATEYANLCDHVVAPSESVGRILQQRGVRVPMTSIPTGIQAERFAKGNGGKVRQLLQIPESAFVVGHVGRLAPEKNLDFLATAVAQFMVSRPDTHLLVVGTGPSWQAIQRICDAAGVSDRLHHPKGTLDHEDLADAYHAMDTFAFASHSETQGMVLAESLTAGVPLVAVDAPGAREVVQDRINGRLLARDDISEFVEALDWVYRQTGEQRQAIHQHAVRTAQAFSMPRCAERLMHVYRSLMAQPRQQPIDDSPWSVAVRRLEEEWKIWSGIGRAVGDAVSGRDKPGRHGLN